MALFFIALKLVLLTRVSKVMNGKKVHLPPRLQPRSQVLSLSLSLSPSLPLSPSLSLPRSVKRVGENPGNEVAVASSIISGVGDGEGKRSLFSFFFQVCSCQVRPQLLLFFQVCSYQIRPQLAGLSYKNQGFISFPTKFLFPQGIICHLEMSTTKQ